MTDTKVPVTPDPAAEARAEAMTRQLAGAAERRRQRALAHWAARREQEQQRRATVHTWIEARKSRR